MSLRFSKESNRNTQCYSISINGHTFGISYTTVIAYWGPLGNCRIKNHWSTTTGRHFSDLGAKDLPLVDDAVMDERIAQATSLVPVVKKMVQRRKKAFLTGFLQSLALKTLTMPDPVGV